MSTRLKIMAWSALGIGLVLSEYFWLEMQPLDLEEAVPTIPSMEAAAPGGMLLPEDVTMASPAVWTDPPDQERGDGWCFEVFAPPQLWQLHENGSWSLTSPERNGPGSEHEAPSEPGFGIEVLAIVRQPFPVQLVGYGLAQDGEAFGIFENASDGAILVARKGSALGGMAQVVEELMVLRKMLADPDEGACPMEVAEAQVRNALTGDRVTLSTKERRFVGDPWIRYRSAGAVETGIALPHSSVTLDVASFRIASVNPEDASVEVIREPVDGGASDVRRFHVPVVESISDSVFAIAQSGLVRQRPGARVSSPGEQSSVQ